MSHAAPTVLSAAPPSRRAPLALVVALLVVLLGLQPVVAPPAGAADGVALVAVQTSRGSVSPTDAPSAPATLPAAPATGNLLRVVVTVDKDSGPWGPAPTGWSYEGTPTTGASVSQAVLYRVATGEAADRAATATWTTPRGAAWAATEHPVKNAVLATATATTSDGAAVRTLAADAGAATAAGAAFATFGIDSWRASTSLAAGDPAWTGGYARTVEQRSPSAAGYPMASTAARTLTAGEATATTATWSLADQSVVRVARYTTSATAPAQVRVPASTQTITVAGERAIVRLPARASAQTAIPVVIHFGGLNRDADMGSTWKPLADGALADGFAVATCDCHTNRYGSPAAMAGTTALWAAIQQMVPTTNLYLSADSHGGAGALNAVTTGALTGVDGVYLVEAVVDLRQRYVSGRDAYIRAAYGISADGSDYAAKTAGYDPALRPASDFHGVPIYVTASPSDTTVPKSRHTDVLVAKLAATNSIRSKDATGGHGNASHFVAADHRAFLADAEAGRLPAPGGTDTAAPPVPGAVSATAEGATQVTVRWSASTDPSGVRSYRVTRDGAVVAAAVAGTSFTDTGARPATTHAYTVSAVDAAGNRSGESSPARVTTPAPPAPGAGVAPVQQASGSLDIGARSLTATLPSAPAAGNLLRVVVTLDKSSGGWKAAPAGWTYEGAAAGGAELSQAALYRVATGGGAAADTSALLSWTNARGAAWVAAEYPVRGAVLAATAASPYSTAAITTLGADAGPAGAPGVAFATFSTDTWTGTPAVGPGDPVWSGGYAQPVESRGSAAAGHPMASTSAKVLAGGDATSTTGTWARADQSVVRVARYSGTVSTPTAP